MNIGHDMTFWGQQNIHIHDESVGGTKTSKDMLAPVETQALTRPSSSMYSGPSKNAAGDTAAQDATEQQQNIQILDESVRTIKTSKDKSNQRGRAGRDEVHREKQ